jgi:hypothetical protein
MDLEEAFLRFAAYALGRTVGRDKVGVLDLKGFEAIDEPIVFCVADLREVEDVVEMLMMFNLMAERCEFAANLRLYGHGWDYRNFDCGVAKVMLSSAISWSGKPLTAASDLYIVLRLGDIRLSDHAEARAGRQQQRISAEMT